LDAEQSSSRGAALGESATPSQSPGVAAGYNALVPEKCKAGLEVANAGKPLAALNGDASSILERLRNGEGAANIAKDVGVSDVALYAFLLRNAPEQWQEISAGKALSRYEKAKSDLDAASDQIGIGKARESGKFAQWDLERASRKLYGDNKQDQGGITVQVLIARDGETHTKIIDAEAA
jgi:hypothetical protein